ncbi:MAG: DUF262 domain-containing protein [Thermoleophilia bacterium]|nr:DUF262 domain-containing protein [Thermoleophilia bacterium]
MKPHRRTIREVFSAAVRYEIPRYQRPYVWQREVHWEPLWGDLEGLLQAIGDGQQRNHFMGAIVLQSTDAAPGGVSKWRVIDGQQRLTTLQILLASAAAAADEAGAAQAARRFRRLVANDPDEATPDELLKLSPTSADRETFELVMREGGPPPDAPDDPDNTIQEAFAYFGDTIRSWALDRGPESEALAESYTTLYGVIGDLLQMVSINLDDDDDAQVIFETMNARGTPLLAIELVKNAVLDRARRQGADSDRLHDDVWEPVLGRSYWRREARQGRLTRARSEIFLSHWLEMKLAEEIPSGRLFQMFRESFLKSEGPSAEALVAELSRHAQVMRGFDEALPESVTGRFFWVLNALDISTFHPLALRLFTAEGLAAERRDRGLQAIESFLVRRMLRGLTHKAYNRLVVDILKAGRRADEILDDVIVDALTESAADTARWPTDSGLADHLATQSLYSWIGQAKIRLVLGEVELRRRAKAKVEDVYKLPKLSIEHLMPTEWAENWPLDDPHEDAVDRRNRSLNLLGNLTLITGSLNAALSNQAWVDKRARLGQNSVLLLNSELAAREIWNEESIADRGRALTAEICARWPGPEAFKPDYVPPTKKPPRGEHHREHAEMPIEEVELSFTAGSVLFRELLVDLAVHADKKRPFMDIEDALGWSKGRLASVLGGYANRAQSAFNGHRPYRIADDEDGRWWMWLDSDRAERILELASRSGG